MSSYKLKVSSYVDVERPSRWNIVHQDDSSDISKGCFNHNYLPTFFVGNQAPDRSIGQSFWPELASSLEILTAAACRQTRRWAKLFSSQWRPMCCRTVDWEAVHLASGALGHGGKWSFVTTVVIDLTQNWLDLRYIQALLKAICCYPLMALDVYIYVYVFRGITATFVHGSNLGLRSLVLFGCLMFRGNPSEMTYL